MLALIAAAAMVAQAPAFDAFAYRQSQPAAFAAELERLRIARRDVPAFEEGERLALLLLARDARSAAEYRRAVAGLAAWRAGVKAEVESILAGRYTTGWLNGRFLNAAARSRDPALRELFRRVFADQYQLGREEGVGEAASARLSADVRSLARANTAWLRRVLARIGWFDISRYGPDASLAAWLVVQHSDHDPAWQAAMLEALAPLVERGEMQRHYFAYLADRVALNAGRPQSYGTQGRCLGPGDWQPHALAEPDGVDRRRAEVGLPTMAEHRAQFACG